MLKWLNNKKKDNKGFSLVELIIVVAIMAILVGLLAPQYLKYVEKSRKSADANNLDQMVQAVQVYAADADETLPAGGYKITIDKDKTEAKGVEATISGDKKTAKGDDTKLVEALTATVPGYATTKLKSNKWAPDSGNTNAGSISATIIVDSEGGTKVTYEPNSVATYVNKANQ